MVDSLFIPSLSKSIFYTSKEDKHLFLNQDLPNWLVLNQNSAYIVGLIDGIKTVKDIIETLKSQNIFLEDTKIISLFQELKNYGIINDEEFKSNKLHNCSSLKKPKLHIAHLQLTNECNLSCTYCLAESGGKYTHSLTLDKLKETIDELNNISSNISYTVSGGEPLMYPHALELIEYLYTQKKEIHLLTNGILVTKDNCKQIAKMCPNIKISIDGSTEEINAITRGKNALEGAMRGYELLLAENANVSIAMTVTKVNINDISNMVKIFGNRLSLQPFFKTGRGTENDYLEITGIEYYEALANIEGLQPLGNLGRKLENIRGRGITKCAMGDGEIAIADNGDVFPCQMLMEDEFKAGSIHENSIEEMLNSPAFKEVSSFSSLKNDECNVCPIKLLCGGSCRARSYLETGSIFKNSGFCDYEKLAYINGIFEAAEFNTNFLNS